MCEEGNTVIIDIGYIVGIRQVEVWGGWLVGDELKMVPADSGNVVILSHDASVSVLAQDIVKANNDVLTWVTYIFLPHPTIRVLFWFSQFCFMNILWN